MNKRIAKAIPDLATPKELAAQRALIERFERESHWALQADRVDELIWAMKLLSRAAKAIGLSDITLNFTVNTHKPDGVPEETQPRDLILNVTKTG